jgi:hypothetical protein
MIVRGKFSKWLIEKLVKKHNDKCAPEYAVEVAYPTPVTATLTVNVRPGDYEEEQEFLENILKEKKYDLRQQLMSEINEMGLVKETVKKYEDRIDITLKMKIWE